MYIVPGKGRQPLGDKLLMSTESLYHFAHLLQVLKKIALLFIYILFHVSPYVYSSGQGQTIHWGQNFDDNRKAFSLCPYAASFKMVSSKSDFIHIFNDFIHVYSPGKGQKTPWGQTFDVNRKPLSLRPFVASFKQISFNSDFIHIF